MAESEFVGLSFYTQYTPDEMIRRSESFLDDVRRRRSVRDFSARPVPVEVLQNCILAGGSAPSGANKQPWHFVIVSNPEVKRNIRHASEKIEHELYEKRASKQWIDALAPLGTGPQKPFLS